MNCESVYEVYGRNYGAPRHAKPVSAKRLVIRDYASARKDAPRGQASTNDGRWVVIEEAVCNTHLRTLPHGTITIPVEDVSHLRGWAGLASYAARVYEQKRAEEAARRAEQEASYARHRQDEYDNVTFKVEEEQDHRSIAGWIILSVEPERGERPVVHVTVEASEGRAWVRTAEYMNSGRGRGSARYVHTLIAVYQQAVTAAIRWNEANGA